MRSRWRCGRIENDGGRVCYKDGLEYLDLSLGMKDMRVKQISTPSCREKHVNSFFRESRMLNT